MTTSLFWLPVALYLVGWLAEFLRYWSDWGDRLRWSRGMLGVGWGAHTFLLVALAVQDGFNLSLLLLAASWLALLLYYLVMQRRPSAVLPFVIPPLSIALLITAYFSSGDGLVATRDLGLTLPATRNILMAHIASVLGGTLLFGLGCLVSIFYLVQERRLKSKLGAVGTTRLPSLGALENYNHRAITLGFFLMTVGLLLGLIVAGVNTLPHRMFSLRQVIPTAVWLVYAVFLLAHDLQGRRGRFGAIWSIIGFAVVVTSLISEIVILTSRG
jgi:ABC-type uncharacterized transport system permease subunit